MSARKTTKLSSADSSTTPHRLTLATHAVRVAKNGIEFHSAHPIPIWKEMTADLETVFQKKIHCTGVIVACAGNRREGFMVSMLFTHVSKQAQTILGSLAEKSL